MSFKDSAGYVPQKKKVVFRTKSSYTFLCFVTHIFPTQNVFSLKSVLSYKTLHLLPINFIKIELYMQSIFTVVKLKVASHIYGIC